MKYTKEHFRVLGIEKAREVLTDKCRYIKYLLESNMAGSPVVQEKISTLNAQCTDLVRIIGEMQEDYNLACEKIEMDDWRASN